MILAAPTVLLFTFSVGIVSAAPDSRATICIDGDNEFDSSHGVNGGGDGSEGNPYIIENWVINASSAHGIHIRNTTKYFIIRNCLVENGGEGYHGIYLENVRNGKIENVISRNNSCGIYLDSSHNNTLENNTVENNLNGIYLGWASDNNTLRNNLCRNNLGNPLQNTGIGIYVSSENNILDNNRSENNSWGIWLWNSKNSRLTNNVCENNTAYGLAISGYELAEFTHSIDNSNLVNGKPVIYLLGKENIIINQENQVGSLMLVDSDNVRVENLTTEAILFAYTHNSWVENSTLRGLFNWSSDNNSIQNNVCENGLIGVYIRESENLMLRNNTIGNSTYNFLVEGWVPSEFIHDIDDSNCVNGRPIIYLVGQNNVVINQENQVGYLGLVNCENVRVENLVTGNNGQGILLAYVNNSLVENNRCENNLHGIYLYSSHNNTISGNQVENNGYGIYLWSSSNNTISGNTVENNSWTGILLESSDNNTISINTVGSSDTGICLGWDCDNNTISGNTVENNSWTGISLWSSSNNTISGNQVENNGYGIYLWNCDNNTISGNTVENNSWTGISLWSSSNNTISGNIVRNNLEGIFLSQAWVWDSESGEHLENSDSNTISGNTVENCDTGIHLYSSSNNTLSNNTARNNSLDISFIDSHNNLLQANAYENSSGIPHISNVGCSNITQSSATIAWTTAESSTSVVEYGTSTAYGSTATDGITTSHSVTLSGLSAGTTYHYRVRSTDGDNNTEISQDYTFTTLAAPPPPAPPPPAPSRTGTVLTVEPSTFSLTSGGSLTLTATLRDSDNRPLVGKLISWSEQENRGTFSQLSGSTNENGQVKVVYTAPAVTGPENVRITFRFAGDDSYLGATAIAVGGISPAPPAPSRLTISPGTFTVASGENVELTVRLTDESGLPLAGKTIALSASLGEVRPSTGVTDNSGQVRAIYLAPTVEAAASVTITASFAGDSRWLASRSTCSGTILPSETGMKLENLVSALENRAVELAIPIAGENLRLVENSFIEGRLGACLSVGVADGVSRHTVEFLHPELAEPRVRVETGKKIEVVVESTAVAGKTLLLNIENQVLQVPADKIEVLFDGKKIGPADDYADVLDPTNEGVPEYLVVAGGRGMQVLVSVPSFSVHTITIQGPAAAGTPWAPLLTAVAVIAIVLVLLFVFRRKKLNP
jgi:parallel beta-helix repeat protein